MADHEGNPMGTKSKSKSKRTTKPKIAPKSMFQVVMTELASAFETAKRTSSGENFVRLKREGRPEWLSGSDVMREIHSAQDDRFPDDWTYAAIESLAGAFHDHDSDSERKAENDLYEIVDSLVDVYNHDRLMWLASHLANAAIVDEACEELGCTGDTFDRIGVGQYEAYSRLGRGVIEAVKTEAESRDEASE
jgi:hypothetical protein